LVRRLITTQPKNLPSMEGWICLQTYKTNQAINENVMSCNQRI